jgi:carbonic anhydrase/acetyltransferase-like protein (isoleucine patch superfamily)
VIIPFEGKTPDIADSAWIAPGATIIGDVVLGERCSVWPGAVIRGDYAPIRIGTDVNVQDNVVIHTDEPLTIGNDVTIGHAVVVHCREVGDDVLLGNNATLLPGAVIGSHSLVAAGALVSPREQVPEYSLVIGVPGEVRQTKPDRIARMRAASEGPMPYYENALRYRASGIEDRAVWTGGAGEHARTG